MESVLCHLQSAHPGIGVDAMSRGCDRLRENYGIAATPMRSHRNGHPRAATIALIGLDKIIDTIQIAAWVRRHDVVIVPGAGVLETSLPVRPWEMPYALFVLCASGRLFRTKVALVDVGASMIDERSILWLSNAAARLASYRSYRDTLSRDAMRRRGLDTADDHVFSDLVFALPAPPDGCGDPQRVAVGVMSYYGTNEDRPYADEIRASYVEKMKRFVGWLVDGGRQVTLIVGDNVNDDDVVQEIVSDLRAHRRSLEATRVVVESVSSPEDLMRAIQPVGTVVAIRYHNVITALKLGKPTISIGYSAKHDALMADMGMSDFCQSARSLDTNRLMEQFNELERRSHELRRAIREHVATNVELLERQFAELSSLIFESTEVAARTPDISAAAGVS